MRISPDNLTVLKGADVMILTDYLIDVALGITDMLNELSERGAIDALVSRYLSGDTFLTNTTQQARDVYKQLIPEESLPKMYRRRWLDIAASRIKDILKEEATKKKISQLVAEYSDLGDSEIAQLFYKQKKNKIVPKGIRVPKAYEVARIRSATNKLSNGEIWKSKPLFSPKLPLSKADQISKVRRVKGGFVLQVNPDGGTKTSEYFFSCPNDEKFKVGKICKPDVLINNGELVFIFAVRHKAPTVYEAECDVPVDVGVLLPFTACAMNDECRSQVVYPDDEIMRLVRYIEDRSSEKQRLLEKSDNNLREGRSARLHELGLKQRSEMNHLADCITRAKRRIGELVAHRVVTMAFSLKGRIVLEKLSWAVPSHAFFQSIIQENIVELASRNGVPIVKVNARGTSSDCPDCGEKLKQGKSMRSPVCVPSKKNVQRQEKVKRGVGCPRCGLRGHHDAVSPYNIGKKSLKCSLPKRFVRLKFASFSWSELPPGWRRAPQYQLRPFSFLSQVLVVHGASDSP